MNKLYTIKPGHTFREADGTVKTGGDTVELPSDVAAMHAGAIDLVDDERPTEPAALAEPAPSAAP